MVCPLALVAPHQRPPHIRELNFLCAAYGEEKSSMRLVFILPQNALPVLEPQAPSEGWGGPHVFSDEGKSTSNSLIIQLTPQLPILLLDFALLYVFQLENIFT